MRKMVCENWEFCKDIFEKDGWRFDCGHIHEHEENPGCEYHSNCIWKKLAILDDNICCIDIRKMKLIKINEK